MEASLLNNMLFGNTLAQYAQSLLIVLFSILLAKIMYYVIKKYVYILTAKTETKLDDILIQVMEKPLVVLIVILGVSYARTPLTLPQSVNSFFDAFIGVLLTLDIAWFVMRFSDGIIQNYIVPMTEKSPSKLDDQLVPIVKNGLKAVILALTILSIVSNFGYDITAVLGGLGIAGIAIAMAANHSLSHLIGGATIFADRPFEVGDTVKIRDVFGKVEEVGMRSTRIRTFDRTLMVIPNADVANAIIENFTKAPKRRVILNLAIEYETSPKKIQEAKQIFRNIVKGVEGLDNEDMSIDFTQFADSSLILRAVYYVKDVERWFQLQDIVNTKIHEEFAKAKINFAFPSRTVYMKKN